MALRSDPLAQAAQPVARRRGRAGAVVGNINVGSRQPVFGRLRLDVGRLIMVPALAAVVVADAFSLDHGSHSGAAGVLRSVGTVLALAFRTLAICGLQIYRALREEQVLLHALPAFRSYRAAPLLCLLPGVF